MSLPIDQLLMLQLLIAVFIVATLPCEQQTTAAADTPPADAEPFQLNDGNTYVEHAGMTIEQELYQLVAPRR